MNFTDDEDFERKFWIKKFLQIQGEVQMSQHLDQKSIFFPVVHGDIPGLQLRIEGMTEDELCAETDVVGASIVHCAYLYKKYEVAHYLVRKYPKLGLQPYSGKIPQKLLDKLEYENIPDPDSYKMPYTGENILHMVIVRRNYNEVRWLLDIYRDHKVGKESEGAPLAKLLNSPAKGSMFAREGVFYFGGFPLHFAACSNDKQIFDLVLSFCAFTGDGSLALDMHSIFQRDLCGNSILHLCVINCLEDMYKHVHETALTLLRQQIIDLWTKRSAGENVYELEGFTKRSDDDGIHGYAMKERLLEMPKSDDDLGKVYRWSEEQAMYKCDERLALAMNDNLHSPITLAGAQLSCDDSDEWSGKRKSMLRFMIGHLKAPLWTFGPVTKVVVDLDGLECRHLLHRYEFPPKLIPEVKNLMADNSNCSGFSAIECLCHNKSDKGFMVPEVQQIIRMKWERVGYTPFLTSFFYHLLLTILTTLTLIYVNATPTRDPNPKYGAEMVVNFIYPICVLLYLIFFCLEMLDLYKLRSKYLGFQIYGIARYDFRCRIL
jgi:hypothetical protein